MALFRKKYTYKEPERITPSEARERRLTAMLEREQRFLAVPNFEAKQKELQASRSRVTTTKIVNDDQPSRQKAASIAAALSLFKESDFSDPYERRRYRDLRRAQEELRAQQRGGGRRKINPTGLDLRSFNPTGKETVSTRSGTAARLGSALKSSFLPSFKMPTTVIPCLQRHAQREVMFAKGYAGRGYKTKKRRNWASGVPC